MVKNGFKKVIGKKSTGIIVTILTFVLAFGAIFSCSNLSVAADSLPGIVNIRNEITNNDTPYNILEIVPDKESSEMGFLVEGQEPFSNVLYDETTKSWVDWQTYLAMHSEDEDLDTAEEREEFMDNLYNANTNYVGASVSDDKPVWYQDYTEVDGNGEGVNVILGQQTPVHGYLVPIIPPDPLTVTIDGVDPAIVEVGQTIDMTATVTGTDSAILVWSSSDPTIATVNDSGSVEGVAEGTITLTVTIQDTDPIITDTITVKVIAPTQAVTVEVQPETANVEQGGSIQLTTTVTGSPETGVDWMMSVTADSPEQDITKIAELNTTTGEVTVKADAPIGAKVSVVATHKTANYAFDTCVITVTAVTPAVTINEVGDTTSQEAGTEIQLTANVKGLADTTVTWDSTDKNVATVDQNGLVKCLVAGSTTITVTSNEDTSISDSFELTVTAVPASVKINEVGDTANAKTGQQRQLTATVTGLTNLTVTWESSNTTVATVDQTGFVDFLTAGTTTITAKSNEDNTVLDSCVITVTEPVSVTISVSPTTVTVEQGGSVQLVKTINVTGTADDTVWWISDKPGVVDVDQNGNVTVAADAPVGTTASIAVTSNADNTKYASCTVTVTAATGTTGLDDTDSESDTNSDADMTGVDEDTPSVGWNAEFTFIPREDTIYVDMVNSTTPYYIAEKAIALTEATLEQYPDDYYLYKVEEDALGYRNYKKAYTVGELKALCAADAGRKAEIPFCYVVYFKLLTNADWGTSALEANPAVYEAEDFEYMLADAPYILSDTLVDEKGHTLMRPSQNIYYTGGFTSNNWFKRFVFDIDEASCDSYNIKVTSVTPNIVNAMTSDELDAYDFIYINAGTGEHGADTFNYDYEVPEKDLTQNAVKLIFEKVCNNKIPCITDYALIANTASDTDQTNSMVYVLTCMLMQSDYRGILEEDGTLDTTKIALGSTEVAEWIDNLVNYNDYNYVNGNVMIINSTQADNKLTDKFYSVVYSSDVVEEAYKEVLSEIELENLYRTSDQAAGYAPLSTEIRKSTVVRYIINFISTRRYEEKTYINVLEIQPANVQYPENSSKSGAVSDTELTPKRIRKWLGADSSVTVNITTMNTMEFIGTIEDLNSEYDLIYIGADVYGMQTRYSQSEKRQVPDYYGSDMDYLIYSNVGGITEVKAQFAGHLETDFVDGSNNTVKQTVKARYSGNDITADKHNSLVDYMKGTYPIVVSDMLCSDTKTPDSKRVDNCSYLYSFLKENLDEANVFTTGEIESGTNANFKFYANRGKLDIGTKVVASEESTVTDGTAFVQPGTYDSGNDTTEKHVTYISRENGKYYLKYKFTVTNNGAVYDSTKYTAALYLDSNSDGKFSVEYEKIPDITLTHVASGNTVTNGQLIAGEQYTLTRQVPETYSGVLTWKVEVSQSTNEFIRDSITGYTRLADTEQVEINVLQVRRDGGSPLELEEAIGNAPNTGNNNTLSTLVWGGKCNADGVTYEGIYNDFKFHFTTMTNAEFNTAYDNGTLNLMDYDMLVLGFYDSYDLRYSSETDIDFDSVNGEGGIKEYIDSGKSVLFAHDTTSVTVVDNYKNYYVKNSGNIYTGSYGANVWGYNLNIYIRDMVGLDTYGITVDNKDGISYDVVNSGVDLSTTPEGRQFMAALENKLDENGYYQIGLKALAYKPNSNKTQTVPETQGFLYGWMDWHWRAENSVKYRAERSRYNTDRAERVNEGQITTYPYYLDETIDITRTHHQYFTLDLNTDDDGDGETDLVVWYTMGGKSGDGSHQDSLYSGNSNDDPDKRYSRDANMDDTSEKDVMNNYYIYNKGNITYTGFGDFDSDYWRNKATIVDECKLFVNTLVAAYNASIKEPEITIYESEDNMAPTSAFYEYGDVDNDVAFRENTQRMYFSINDTNVIRGTKTATAEYYVALKDGVVSDTATTYTANGTTYPVYRHTDGVEYIKLSNLKTYNYNGTEIAYNNLQCGVVYYVDIPTSVFDISGVSDQNVNTFMVAGKTTLFKTGAITGKTTKVNTATTYNKVEFIHVELFPLD